MLGMCEYKSKCSININNNIDLFSEKNMIKFPRLKTSAVYDFIFTVNTEFTVGGSSGPNQFRLPLLPGGIYNCIIYWGDGTSTKLNSTSKDEIECMHTYNEPGVYTIRISGQCEGWCFNYSGDYTKIIDISQWGTHFKLGTTQGNYFGGCLNLNISAKNAPNLQGTTSMSYCFGDCTSLDSENLSLWDTKEVISMDGMFSACPNFNTNINNWDVSNVTDMSLMFYLCTTFNQPLNSWNVSNVTVMVYMFFNCQEFNQPLNSWNVENVTSLNAIFYNCPSFKQDISSWNPISCTNFEGMFTGSNMNTINPDLTQNTTNYDNLLNSWASKSLASGMTFDAGDAKRSNTGQPAFITLTTTKGWTINDGGLQS